MSDILVLHTNIRIIQSMRASWTTGNNRWSGKHAIAYILVINSIITPWWWCSRGGWSTHDLIGDASFEGSCQEWRKDDKEWGSPDISKTWARHPWTCDGEQEAWWTTIAYNNMYLFFNSFLFWWWCSLWTRMDPGPMTDDLMISWLASLLRASFLEKDRQESRDASIHIVLNA